MLHGVHRGGSPAIVAIRSRHAVQVHYSDLAIERVLMLRLVFHLALRQAEAFAGSVVRLLGLDLCVPDHTTLSRRSGDFARRRPNVTSSGARH